MPRETILIDADDRARPGRREVGGREPVADLGRYAGLECGSRIGDDQATPGRHPAGELLTPQRIELVSLLRIQVLRSS